MLGTPYAAVMKGDLIPPVLQITAVGNYNFIYKVAVNTILKENTEHVFEYYIS